MSIIDNPANAEVLTYLKQKSSPTLLAGIAPHSELAYTDYTHPELADLLEAASKNLPDGRTFHVFGFLVLASPRGVLCALAESTSTLAFRLSEELRSAAFQSGAKGMESLGNNWVVFNPWKLSVTDHERITVFQLWCEHAYAYVEERFC